MRFTRLCCGAHAAANDIDALPTLARWVSCARPPPPQRNLRGGECLPNPAFSPIVKIAELCAARNRPAAQTSCAQGFAYLLAFEDAIRASREAHAGHPLDLTEPT